MIIYLVQKVDDIFYFWKEKRLRNNWSYGK